MREKFAAFFFAACVFFSAAPSAFARGSKDVPDEREEDEMSRDEKIEDEKAARILERNNGAAYEREALPDEPVLFNEVWAFLTNFYAPAESAIDPNARVTDLALFGAEISSAGELSEIPSRSKARNFDGRVHFAFACNSRGVTHFCLDPKYDLRESLLDSLARETQSYDGIVVDLEYMLSRDKSNFISFLRELKKRIGKKILTVCVPARLSAAPSDVFAYKEIGAIADRVLVMAYDEHWSGSKSGPVASFDWCEKIADHALSEIPAEKIVMGVPFYARAWMKGTNPTGAWRYSTLNRHFAKNSVSQIERTEGGEGRATWKLTVELEAYFDDAFSLRKKCEMYSLKGIGNLAAWCLGQEDSEFWKQIAPR